jgi:m7GpppX diphosphatase
MIHETADAYRSEAMQDFIQVEIAKKQWIYRIIEGEKEQESVLYRCDDFIILPDTDAFNDEAVLNWIVIFTDTALISMRCLRGEHVPVLQAIKAKVDELVPSQFALPMIYFHYPPSVWQLHLHVSAPCDALRTTNSMQKVCFLEDVICNLRIDSDYYEKATMTFILPSNHELTQLHTPARPILRLWGDDVACPKKHLSCPG